jgi:hypothetical protein
MNLIILIGFSLLLPMFARGGGAESNQGAGSVTNVLAVPDGWLQLPSHELVLDLEHESLDYGSRLNASEFLGSLLEVLLKANYKVRLSDAFIQREIKYYRENLSHETPTEMSRAILNCLETARASGTLDWNCFQGELNRSAGPLAAQRHLPWMAPPFKAKLVSLAGGDCANLACLYLKLHWTGRGYGGAVQHTRRPGGLPGETVLTEGRSRLSAFEAVMRLSSGGQAVFEKSYPREEWQNSYATIYEQPLWKTSQAILQDLSSGLRQAPTPPVQTQKKKTRKH